MQFYVKFDNGIFSGLFRERKSGDYFPYVSSAESRPDETVTCVGFKWLVEGETATGIYEYSKVEPPPAEVKKYSTLSIKRELDALGKWTQVKSLLEQAGVSDDYFLANYLSSEDPVFKAALPKVVELGILTQEQLEELLEKCVWKE